ncbi:MAG: hypothetical protein HY691_02155 [Chloroflexi bacterium]|nr:hypothetical protein [Chloroflexota bacterium]
MEAVTPLEQYRLYLESVEEESPHTPASEYLELLSPGEALDLLTIRDRLSTMSLSPAEQRELARLDELLMKHQRLVVDNIPHFADEPRTRWWWHLHEGPQVREEALAAAQE